MTTKITINPLVNEFDLVSIGCSELILIMMSLIATKRVLEQRKLDDPSNPSTDQQIMSIKTIIDKINNQYPNWAGQTNSLLDNSISETLNDHKIYNNRITII
ncbi:MAG: hypothetical protein HOO91_06100 [Bacteroidales bacterium]|nr:hypothetical protein [Bacteroidales bacterium]